MKKHLRKAAPLPDPAGPRNAVAFEWSRETEAAARRAGDYKMPAGSYIFMTSQKGERYGIKHGCPCGCGGASAMWFEGFENAGGPKWAVTGEWPKVTLSPSIGIGKDRVTGKFHWHGYLEKGVFVER